MKKKLLVVEDEKSLLALFTGVLKKEKDSSAYEVFDAGNYDEAVKLAESHEFDLVLTDYHLPGKDGVTLIQDMKARNPRIACVIISGYLSPAITAQAMEAGAYVCLKKPCSIHLIRETVTEALAADGTHSEGHTQAATASPHREDIRRLIENYPHKAFFIDTDRVIKSTNSLFAAAYRGSVGKRCHEVLFGQLLPCASCTRMNDDRTHVVVSENENSEIIKEQVEPWHNGGKGKGYIVSILSLKGESQEEESPELHDLKNNFYILAIGTDGRIKYAGTAITNLFSGGESIHGRFIEEFVHSYFIQHLKKEHSSFVQYALVNDNQQVTLDFITKDSLKRHSLLCEFRKNDGAFPKDWAVLVICMDTHMRNELYRIVEFERESMRQLR
ncbi:MAG: response regulator, partial [Spirochaetaceae bacterium]